MDDNTRALVSRRVVELRDAALDQPLSFTAIAKIVQSEFGLSEEDGARKDVVQKLYWAYQNSRAVIVPGVPPAPVIETHTVLGNYALTKAASSVQTVDPLVGIADTVKNVIEALSGQTPVEDYPEDDTEPTDGLTDKFRAYFGDSWQYSPDVYDTYLSEHELLDSRRVVAVGDLHGSPASDLGRLIALLDPDLIVIGGDSLDNRQASPHGDTPVPNLLEALIAAADDQAISRPPTIREEVATVRAFIQSLIDSTTAKILVMRGNHDNWIWRKASEGLPEWARSYFMDILDVLLYGLPRERVELATSVWTYNYPDGSRTSFGDTQYLLPLGDAVLSHMDFTSKLPGGAVRRLAERMTELYMPLGLPDPRLLVQFHGHKVCSYDDRAGHRTLVEPGMGGSADTEGYKVNYKGSWSLGAYGFVQFEQYLIGQEWKTDLSSVNVVRPRRRLPIDGR